MFRVKALLVLLLILLGLILVLLSERREGLLLSHSAVTTGPEVEGTSPDVVPSGRSLLSSQHSSEEDATAVPSASIVVSSTLGLGPSRVHVSSGGVESWVALGKSGSLDSLRMGDELTFPGHHSKVWRGEPVLEVAPVLGVALEAQALAKYVTFAEVVGVDATTESAEGSALIAGFATPNRFAIAVDGAAYQDQSSKELRFALNLSDGRVVKGQLNVDAAGTHEASIPYTFEGLVGVGIEFACLDNCVLPKKYKWWAEVPELEDRRRDPPRSIDYPWGTLTLGPGYKPSVATADGTGIRLEGLASGQVYGIGCICVAHRRYARSSFVATSGAYVSLLSQEGFTLEGTIQPATLDNVWITARFFPSLPYVSRAGSWHHDEKVSVRRGRFSVSYPNDIPIRTMAPDTLPPFMRLTAKAPTCTEVVTTLEWSLPTTMESLSFDCSTDFTLHMADAPLHAEELAFLLFLDEEGRLVRGFVGGVDQEDDRLHIRLKEKTLRWTPKSPMPEYVIASGYSDTQGYVSLPFVATPDGYRSAPTTTTNFVVDDRAVETALDQIYAGWTWKGIPAPIDIYLSGRSGRRHSYTYQVPRTASHLWWANHEHGPDGDNEATGAMAPISEVLVIP